MSSLQNATVLITGGASGIGKLMGKSAIEKRCLSLVLWDINKAALDETVNEFSQLIKNVFGYVVDVSDPAQIVAAAARVRNDVGPIDILINNAGIVVGKYFHEHTHDDINKTMSINADALMHVTLEFLPEMITRNRGHIVTIASAGGMVGNPRMSLYVASKWAAIGWSDSLRLEMQKLGNDVQVTCITPYYINTGMFAGVKSSFLIPIVSPEYAVNKIIHGIESDRLYVRMPLLVYTLQFVKGILPTRLFDLVVGKWLKVYSTMDEFTGKK